MKNPIKALFANAQYHVSPKTVEREKYLFYCCVTFRRWMLLPICSLIQMCLGSFYSWSVYNIPLSVALSTTNFEVTADDASEVFYVCVGLFGLSSCFAGPWVERAGPRLPCFIGILLFFIGHLVSALGIHLKILELVHVGFGMIGGIGIGIGYLVPVGVLQKYYPEKRGLASGIAVGAFGLGSVIASFTQSALINALGLRNTFITIGAIYFLIGAPLALLLRVPAPTQKQTPVVATAHIDSDITPSNSTSNPGNLSKCAEEKIGAYLKSKKFFILYAVFFTSVIPGLVLVSRVANVVEKSFHKDAATSVWIVGVNGFFNVIGRLFFGILSDKLGRLPILMGSIVTEIVVLGLMLYGFNSNQFYLVIVNLWLLTGCYGAALGLVPSLITDCFGSGMISALYGVLLTAWASGGVIGGIGVSKLLKAQKDIDPLLMYNLCIYILIPIAFISLCVCIYFFWYLRSNAQQQRKHAERMSSSKLQA